MSDKLKTLSAAQKKVVVGIACYIEAQGKGGRFRSDEPEMDIIVSLAFADPEHRLILVHHLPDGISRVS